MENQTFYKKTCSKLSCSRLLIVGECAETVQVRAYNFRDQSWMKSARQMTKAQPFKNYDLEV